MSNESLLLIPMRIDALNLKEPRTMVSPTADFSQLPYTAINPKTNNHEDHNPNTAFVSEAIMSSPFQNVNFTLNKGVHLHWSLPDTLTNSGDSTEFPAVPNKWYVLRKKLVASNPVEKWEVEKEWVVESDEFLPEDTASNLGYTNVPLQYDATRIGKPYRLMGKKTILAKWKTPSKSSGSWKKSWGKSLTAVGYGHPLFASFYPNCMSVFGAWDDLETAPNQTIKYEVIGWYDDSADDVLLNQTTAFSKKPQQIYLQPLKQQFQDRGQVVWESLYSAGMLSLNQAIVNIPEGDSKYDKKIKEFLNPAPIKSLLNKEALFNNAFMKQAAQAFHKDLINIWDDLTKKNKWLTPIHGPSVQINKGEIDKTENALTGIGASWTHLLKTMFSDPSNRKIVFKKDSFGTQSKYLLKKYWDILAENKIILPLNTNTAFVNAQAVSSIGEITALKAVATSITTYLNSPKRPVGTSHDFIEKQFRVSYSTLLWNELLGHQIITEEITLDNNEIGGIIGTERNLNWVKLSRCFQRYIPDLKKIMNASTNQRIISKDRITNRYGTEKSGGIAIWNALKTNKWISPIKLKTNLAIVNKKLADSPVKSQKKERKDMNTASDELVKVGTIDDFIVKVLLDDLRSYRLFNLHDKKNLVNEANFSNRFKSEYMAWENLYEDNFIFTLNGIVGEENIKEGSASGPMDRIAFLKQLPVKDQMVSRSNVLSYFDKRVNLLWKDYFERGWLIYDEAKILSKGSRAELSDSFLKQKPEIERVVPESIEKEIFLEEFGQEKGPKIWSQLLTNAIIKGKDAEAIEAYIPSAIDPEKLELTPDLKKEKNAILRLLTPTTNRNYILDHFPKNGSEIWQELLSKNWLIGVVTDSAQLKTIKPWLSSSKNPTATEDAKQFIQLTAKKDAIKSIEKNLNWTPGIQLDLKKGEFSVELLTELQEKGWIGTVNSALEKALLEPEENRKALGPKFANQLPKVRVWMNKGILKATLPTQSCFFGKVTLSPTSTNENSDVKNKTVNLSVGNTSTEALSAFLADKMFPNKPKLKSNAEDQLEAIQLERKMNNQQLDLAAKFGELRHEKEFRAQDGGRIWQVVLENGKDADQKTETAAQIDLPVVLAHQLNELNKLQRAYEDAVDNIADLRKQLFVDWYKYQLCIYPPAHANDDYPNIDEVKTFIQRFDLDPLNQEIEDTGELEIIKTGEKISRAKDAGDGDNKAGQLAKKINALLERLTAENEKNTSTNRVGYYTLKQIPGPRFWEPTDPALLIEGNLMKSNLRHGKDGRLRLDNKLQCYTASSPFVFKKEDFNVRSIQLFIQKLEDVYEQKYAKNPYEDSIAFNHINEQPWNALTMEWEVDFRATNDPEGPNLKGELGYDTDFIIKQFKLKEDQPDFSSNTSNQVYTNSYYTHNSILTDYVKPHFGEILKTFIAKRLKKDKNEKGLWDLINIGELLWDRKRACAKANPIIQIESDALYNAIFALQKMEETDFMSQNLSGFNHELLMQKQTMQLPVADPLAFSNGGDKDSGAAFAKSVQEAIGKSNFVAPEPQSEFNPIRSGKLLVNKLRLIDTFGQICDLSTQNLVKANGMEDHPDPNFDPDQINLNPRLAEPARINFRWLSAHFDDIEMNSHPATSPIFGWVLPNYLDDSILIYNHHGEQILELTEAGELKIPPFVQHETVDSIITGLKSTQKHLHDFCLYLANRSTHNKNNKQPKFLSDFLNGISGTMENIHPEYFSRHKDLALLMGRPLALARISVGIEHKGLPAVNQDWTIFRSDMQKAFKNKASYGKGELEKMIRETRETYQTDKVIFPIRIGDYLQLNDGLVGYWDQEKMEGAHLIFPHSDLIFDDSSKSLKSDHDHGGEHYIKRTLSDGNQNVTLLFDPTGKLHATSGILPTKTINIPEDQYLNALKKIKVNFLSAPILTERNKIQIPVPEEAGMKWSWMGYENKQWVESPFINRNDFAREWQQLQWKENALGLWQFLDETIAVIQPSDDELKCTLLTLNSEMKKAINTNETWKDYWIEIIDLLAKLKNQNKETTLSKFVKTWGSILRTKREKEGQNLWAYLLSLEIAWLELQKDGTVHLVSAKKQDKDKLDQLPADLKAAILTVAQSVDPKKVLTLASFTQHYLTAKSTLASEAIWNQLIAKNWLTGDSEMDKHIALSKKQRENSDKQPEWKLDPDFIDYRDELSELLEVHGKDIEPVRQEAGFHAQQEIRDGWLSLSKASLTLPKSRKVITPQIDNLVVDVSFDENGLVDGNDLQAKKKVRYFHEPGAIKSSIDEPLNPYGHYFNFLDTKKFHAMRAMVDHTPGKGQYLTYDFWVKDSAPTPKTVAAIWSFDTDEHDKPIFQTARNLLELILPNKTNKNVGYWKCSMNPKDDTYNPMNMSEDQSYNSENWNHWTIVLTAQDQNYGYANIFLNGQALDLPSWGALVNSQIISATINYFDFGLGNWGPDDGFKGKLSRWRVWTSVLEPEEIIQLHQNDIYNQ